MLNAFSLVAIFEVIFFSCVFFKKILFLHPTLKHLSNLPVFSPIFKYSFSLIMQFQLYFDCFIKILISRSVVPCARYFYHFILEIIWFFAT